MNKYFELQTHRDFIAIYYANLQRYHRDAKYLQGAVRYKENRRRFHALFKEYDSEIVSNFASAMDEAYLLGLKHAFDKTVNHDKFRKLLSLNHEAKNYKEFPYKDIHLTFDKTESDMSH